MDLESLFTIVYVVIDDWYKEHIAAQKPKVGAPPTMSESEVLTVAIVGQWRVGVPWRSERGLVRYMQRHGLDMFPTMLERSAFNQRVRHLWGVLVECQQWLTQQLEQREDVYECVDSTPIPAGTLGQLNRESGHWLWDCSVGRGPHGWFWGDRILVSVTPGAVITGWILAAASINDRWLMEAFVSARAGRPQLVEPPRRKRDAHGQRTPPPVGFIGPLRCVGKFVQRPYLADGNFNGRRWRQHWLNLYGADVITAPKYNEPGAWSSAWKYWLSRHRQVIETTFAVLDRVFAIKHLQAHSRWGQFARLAAKMAAYNFGIWINRLLNRPNLSHETLLS